MCCLHPESVCAADRSIRVVLLGRGRNCGIGPQFQHAWAYSEGSTSSSTSSSSPIWSVSDQSADGTQPGPPGLIEKGGVLGREPKAVEITHRAKRFTGSSSREDPSGPDDAGAPPGDHVPQRNGGGPRPRCVPGPRCRSPMAGGCPAATKSKGEAPGAAPRARSMPRTETQRSRCQGRGAAGSRPCRCRSWKEADSGSSNNDAKTSLYRAHASRCHAAKSAKLEGQSSRGAKRGGRLILGPLRSPVVVKRNASKLTECSQTNRERHERPLT